MLVPVDAVTASGSGLDAHISVKPTQLGLDLEAGLFSDLAAEMMGAQYLPLKKGELARFDTTLPLHPAGALLRWLVPPDLIAEEA